MGSYGTREKNKILKQTQTGAGEKIKYPARNFIQQTKKEKPLHPCKGLSICELYAIAARGCIVVKWREQRYNL